MRQEFERHRFVKDLPVLSVLIAKGQMEYQVICEFGLSMRDLSSLRY